MKTLSLVSLLGLLLAAPMPALAQARSTMPGMQHDAPAAEPGASEAYRDAMMKMHRDMDRPLSGNPDRDFVTGMIPHHQGAIDMAQVELRYGKDPQLRKLARAVVAAQEKEIAEMRQWLAKHPQ